MASPEDIGLSDNISPQKIAPKKIALALGGGAGLGWAHIGVIRALEQHGVEITAIAGTSIGAIVGAAFAAGKLDDMEELARSITHWRLMRYLDPHLKRGALLGGRRIEAEMSDFLGDRQFSDLHIPFAAVAADLMSGQAVEIDAGAVVPAIRASMSLPGLFAPVERDGAVLIDGGAASPVPINATKKLLQGGNENCPILAVSLQNDYQGRAGAAGILDSDKKSGSTRILRAAIDMMLASYVDAVMAAQPPDYILRLPVGHIDIQDFSKADELIEIGHQEMEKLIKNMV